MDSKTKNSFLNALRSHSFTLRKSHKLIHTQYSELRKVLSIYSPETMPDKLHEIVLTGKIKISKPLSSGSLIFDIDLQAEVVDTLKVLIKSFKKSA
jgi:hypothetical protein